MNKEQSEIFTKIILCAILVLVLCVLYHVLKSPEASQIEETYSPEKLKEELIKTQKTGDELDKKYLNDYVDNLKAPVNNKPETKKEEPLSVAVPKGFTVVGYETVNKE